MALVKTNAKRGKNRAESTARRTSSGVAASGIGPGTDFTAEHRQLSHLTSRWDAVMHRTRAGAFQEAERSIQEPIRTDSNLRDAKAAEVADLAESLGRELFSRLYADPAKIPPDERKNCPAWVDPVHDVLDALPEWDVLRRAVRGDADFSALGAARMLSVAGQRLPDLIRDVEERARQRAEEKARREQERQEQRDRGEDPGPEPEESPEPAASPEAQEQLRAGLRAACQAAIQEGAEDRDALATIAPGTDKTPPANQQADPSRMALIQMIHASEDFREIARRAGRIRRIAGRVELRRSRESAEEVVDVEMGADISRMLPSELALLLDEDTEWPTMARLADGAVLCYRLEGTEPLGRGPVVYLRDVSGSMRGDPHLWGAAIGIALTAQAASQKRPIISASFNHETHGARWLRAGELSALDSETAQSGETLATGPGAVGAATLAHATDGCSGGTSFDEPVQFALRAGLLEPRADFVFLTDGYAAISDDVLAKLVEAKGAGLRVFGVLVGTGTMTEAVASICDEVLDLNEVVHDAAAGASRLGSMIGRAR